jgi:hypothetical protein
MVYVVNAQECFSGYELITLRNILFTAITRSRAWVRLCGWGPDMAKLTEEIEQVRRRDFRLEFRVPTEEELKKMRMIHRELTEAERAKRTRAEKGLAEALGLWNAVIYYWRASLRRFVQGSQSCLLHSGAKRMTPKQLATEMRNLFALLLESEIAIVTNAVVAETAVGRNRLTWRSPSAGAVLGGGGPFATIDEYLSHLKAEAYVAILYDGSLLQMSYDFMGTELVGHRLCYYPCPFEVDRELLLSEPVADVVDYYRQQGDKYLRLRSPVRFDFDERNAGEGHPAVHVHVLWAHCRLPVVAPLSPGHFIRFIFANFYPGMWLVHSFLREWPQRLGARTIGAAEEFALHISCRRE